MVVVTHVQHLQEATQAQPQPGTRSRWPDITLGSKLSRRQLPATPSAERPARSSKRTAVIAPFRLSTFLSSTFPPTCLSLVAQQSSPASQSDPHPPLHRSGAGRHHRRRTRTHPLQPVSDLTPHDSRRGRANDNPRLPSTNPTAKTASPPPNKQSPKAPPLLPGLSRSSF